MLHWYFISAFVSSCSHRKQIFCLWKEALFKINTIEAVEDHQALSNAITKKDCLQVTDSLLHFYFIYGHAVYSFRQAISWKTVRGGGGWGKMDNKSFITGTVRNPKCCHEKNVSPTTRREIWSYVSRVDLVMTQGLLRSHKESS